MKSRIATWIIIVVALLAFASMADAQVPRPRKTIPPAAVTPPPPPPAPVPPVAEKEKPAETPPPPPAPKAGALTITIPELPPAEVNREYSAQFKVSGGNGPYDFKRESGPENADFGAGEGGGTYFVWTPSESGEYEFTVKAEDSSEPTPLEATTTFKVKVNPRVVTLKDIEDAIKSGVEVYLDQVVGYRNPDGTVSIDQRTITSTEVSLGRALRDAVFVAERMRAEDQAVARVAAARQEAERQAQTQREAEEEQAGLLLPTDRWFLQVISLILGTGLTVFSLVGWVRNRQDRKKGHVPRIGRVYLTVTLALGLGALLVAWDVLVSLRGFNYVSWVVAFTVGLWIIVLIVKRITRRPTLRVPRAPTGGLGLGGGPTGPSAIVLLICLGLLGSVNSVFGQAPAAPTARPAARITAIAPDASSQGYQMAGDEVFRLTMSAAAEAKEVSFADEDGNVVAGITVADLKTKGRVVEGKLSVDSSVAVGIYSPKVTLANGTEIAASQNVELTVITEDMQVLGYYFQQKMSRLTASDPAFRHFLQAYFQYAFGKDEGNKQFVAFVKKPSHEATAALLTEHDKGLLKGAAAIADDRIAASGLRAAIEEARGELTTVRGQQVGLSERINTVGAFANEAKTAAAQANETAADIMETEVVSGLKPMAMGTNKKKVGDLVAERKAKAAGKPAAANEQRQLTPSEQEAANYRAMFGGNRNNQ